MSDILEILLDITLGSLLTAGGIILIRILFRNILSAKAKYYLWLLLALRLLLPSLPESPTSLMNLFPEKAETQQLMMVETAADEAPIAPEPVYAATAPLADPALEVVVDTQVSPENATEVITAYAIAWDDLAVILWGIGVGVTLLVFIILYILTARTLHKKPHCADADTLRVFLELRKNLGIRREIRLVQGSGGMSGGLFRPTIVIPPEQHGEDLKPILLHELMHIRARDLWLMAFYRLLCALNWFNPVVWLCFHRANLDSEAACDQRVLETGLVEKSSYAEVLYRESLLKSTDRLYFRTAFGGGKHAIRDRIQQITRFAGKKTWMVPLVLVLAVVVSACTLTGKNSEAPTVSAPASTNSIISVPDIADNSQTSILDIPWDITPEEVMELLDLDSENTLLSENSSGATMTALSPLPDYPEITKMEFMFNNMDDLPALRGINIQYDREKVTFDELVTLRTTALGEPTSKETQQAEWFDQEHTTLVVNDEYSLNEYVRKIGPLSIETAEATATPFSPVEKTGNTLNFQNCQWGMTPEEVVAALDLDPEQCTLTNKGKNYTLTAENPMPEHPEILKLEFTFHFIDFDLTLGLDRAEVRYNTDLISCHELIEERSMQLGDPTTADESSAQWSKPESAWLTIAESNFLTETIVANEREFSEETIANFNLEEYVSTLHPPGGHYGWTFEEHVENGLLSPDSGVYTDYGNGEAIFFTTIELGGETVDAQYCFTQSYLTYGTNAPLVLREMLVELPEDVWLSKWIERFSDSFTDKLFESTEMTYKTPIAVGSLLTEAQQEAIMEASFAQTGNGATTGGWALIFNWYDSTNRIWRFNGTGYTLYLDAMALK